MFTLSHFYREKKIRSFSPGNILRQLIYMNIMYVLQITFAMCWGFLLSWMPYAVVSMWTAYGVGETVPIHFTVIAVLLAKSSIVINPVIYFLMSKKFRPLLLKTLKLRSSKKAKVVVQRFQTNKYSVGTPAVPVGVQDTSSSKFFSESESADVIQERVRMYKCCENEAEV